LPKVEDEQQPQPQPQPQPQGGVDLGKQEKKEYDAAGTAEITDMENLIGYASGTTKIETFQKFTFGNNNFKVKNSEKAYKNIIWNQLQGEKSGTNKNYDVSDIPNASEAPLKYLLLLVYIDHILSIEENGFSNLAKNIFRKNNVFREPKSLDIITDNVVGKEKINKYFVTYAKELIDSIELKIK
jgi:hypothetical protein